MKIQQRRIALAVACACSTLAAGQAAAFEVANKDGWKLDVNGTVNAFYVSSKQKSTTAGVSTETDQANIQNGLLPGWLNFVVTTQQEGFDIKAHFGFAPGIDSDSTIVGLPDGTGRAYAQTDNRNVYFQFGNASMGTLKLGRDIGLFAQTPILNDMTLLGVGGTPRAAEPFNTSFGMIGHGYMYTGFQPQITYSAPAMGGLNASFGLFNPSAFDKDPTNGTAVERKSVGMQGLVTYDWKGSVNGKVWASFVDQKTSGTDGFKATGFEGGVKVGFGPVEVLASAFSAKGLGISTIGAQFLGGWQNGKRLESDGHFVQVTTKAGEKVKLGVGYGKNTDKDLVAVGTESTNKAVSLGAYYNLTKSITLVGEYVTEKEEKPFAATTIDTRKTNTVSLGAILFF